MGASHTNLYMNKDNWEQKNSNPHLDEWRCDRLGKVMIHHALSKFLQNRAYNDALNHCLGALEMCETKQDAINFIKGVGEVRITMTESCRDDLKRLND